MQTFKITYTFGAPSYIRCDNFTQIFPKLIRFKLCYRTQDIIKIEKV